MNRSIIAIAAILVGAATLGSCKALTNGIFYSVENESPLTKSDSSLPKDCTAGALVSANGCYAALVGTVVQGTKIPAANASGVGGSVAGWAALPSPANRPAAVTVASDGSRLYAIYTGNSGEGSSATGPALYTATPDPANLSGFSWSLVDTTALGTGVPSDLISTSGKVLLESAALGRYTLSVLSGGALGATVTGFGDSYNYRPVVALAGPAATALLATASQVFRIDLTQSAPALTPVAAPTNGTTSITDAISAIVRSSPGIWYLATTSGLLASSADYGNTWTLSPAVQKNATGTACSFTALAILDGMADVSGGAAVAAPTILAATLGQGLFLVNADMTVKPQPVDRSNDLLWGGNYSSTSLGSVKVLSPGADHVIYAGSYRKGLWSLRYDSIYRSSTNAVPKKGLIFSWE